MATTQFTLIQPSGTDSRFLVFIGRQKSHLKRTFSSVWPQYQICLMVLNKMLFWTHSIGIVKVVETFSKTLEKCSFMLKFPQNRGRGDFQTISVGTFLNCISHCCMAAEITKVYFHCPVGRVENGNQRVLKNLLAFFAAILYIDQGQIVIKKAPKSFSSQEIDPKTGPNH